MCIVRFQLPVYHLLPGLRRVRTWFKLQHVNSKLTDVHIRGQSTSGKLTPKVKHPKEGCQIL